MEEDPLLPPEREEPAEPCRCPSCDSVIPEDSRRCLMCGFEMSPSAIGSGSPVPSRQVKAQQAQAPASFLTLPPRFSNSKRDRKSLAIGILTATTVLVTALLSVLILRGQGSEVILALQPTFTPLPPAPSQTPTRTPEATATPLASMTPVPSATPVPTDTPRPPRFHSVASGESLFGLSLLYRVSAESIAASNDMPLDSPIQVGQQLSIPWPTATPPLESMVLEIGGEKVVADVTDCEIVTIQEGDSAYGLSAQRGVPAEAIVAVNRLTEESIQLLHPGDTLCIPRIAPGDTLPATPGPLPTATMTAYPAGPVLLYPVDGAELAEPVGIVRLQWVAVKDLAPEEWYMVEMSNLDQLDSLPYRAFTRDSSLVVPSAWRPRVPETHEMRWRVSIVKVTGERSDGAFTYEYGGRMSEDSFFSWPGAEPTPTPTTTPSPTSEATE